MNAGEHTMRAIILVGAALLAACSGTPVQNQYYLLRSDAEQQSRDLSPSKQYAMGRIIVAPYIEQPGLVLETSAGEVRPAMHNQWAEPLKMGLTQFLRVEVSAAVGEDIFPRAFSDGDIYFDLRIDQMHGTVEGDALLVAYWWIQRDGEVLASYQFAETEALNADGYGALANAEKRLLSRLSRKLGESLTAANPG